MAQVTLQIKIWTEGRGKRLPNDLSDLAELFAPHAEHVASLCEQGYQAGEIVDDKFSGWWSITREETRRRNPRSAHHRRRARELASGS